MGVLLYAARPLRRTHVQDRRPASEIGIVFSAAEGMAGVGEWRVKDGQTQAG